MTEAERVERRMAAIAAACNCPQKNGLHHWACATRRRHPRGGQHV